MTWCEKCGEAHLSTHRHKCRLTNVDRRPSNILAMPTKDDWDRVAVINRELAVEVINLIAENERLCKEADRLNGTVAIPISDYKRLLQLVEFDDMLVICETCGAWLDRDDPATATTDDYNGCWKIAAGEEDSDRCKSYRALADMTIPAPEGKS